MFLEPAIPLLGIPPTETLTRVCRAVSTGSFPAACFGTAQGMVVKTRNIALWHICVMESCALEGRRPNTSVLWEDY